MKRSRSKGGNRGRVMAASAAVIVTFAGGAAHGGTYFWDANGAGAGTGGSGTWNGVVANKIWRDGSATGTLKEWG